jgi:hypothetical protein
MENPHYFIIAKKEAVKKDEYTKYEIVDYENN